MLVLKYSPIGHGLTKTINPKDGLYGAVNAEGVEVIKAEYSELRPFDGNRAVALKAGQYIQLDQYGAEYSMKSDLTNNHANNLGFYFPQKSDRCPECFDEKRAINLGCKLCNGIGCIPQNFRFDDID